MDRPLFRLARAVYRSIPYRPARQAVFSVFARLVRRRVVVAGVDGAFYELHLDEMIDLALYLQQFEPDVRETIRQLISPGMTVLDIGANIGAHTLMFATLVGPEGRVVAFEPTDFAFRKLQRNLTLNPALRVEAVRVALAAESATNAHVNFRSSWQTDGSRVNGPGTVDFVRLDDWAAQNGLAHVDLIKLDVDGFEFSVINGGLKTIERWQPTFIIEATGDHFENDATNPFLVLSSLGYTFWDIAGGRAMTIEALRKRLPPHDPMMFSLNLVAAPGERAH